MENEQNKKISKQLIKSKAKKTNRFFRLLKNKWLRNTSSTIAIVAVILAIFVTLNLCINNLNLKPVDFTAKKIYTLSDDSKKEISKIEQNVTMYFFGYEEDSTPVILGRQYEKLNDKIKVQLVSTTERPDLATQYNISSTDQVVGIVSNQRYKAISSSEMHTYDQTSGEQIDVTEQKLTNGIIDVTISSKPQVYFLSGNGEYGIDSSSYMYMFSQYVKNDINDVNTLDLLTSDMPETCDVLVIANPTSDFTDAESEKLQNYINNGGKIIWMQDPYINIQNYNSDNFKNINKILGEFGISFSYGIVCEESSNNMLQGYPDAIIPNMTYNEIVKNIYTDGKVIMPDSGKINTVDSEKLSELKVTASPFITSSSNSFYKEDFSSSNTSITKQDKDDDSGNFVIGEILEKQINDNKKSTLVAYSNSFFVTNYQMIIGNTQTYPILLRNNKDLALNTIAFLSNREDSISIRKATGTDYVTFETASKMQDSIVRVIIFSIPVVLIAVGIAVSIIRKHRK